MVKKFDKFVDRVVRTCSRMWFHIGILSVIHVLPCGVVCPYVQLILINPPQFVLEFSKFPCTQTVMCCVVYDGSTHSTL